MATVIDVEAPDGWIVEILDNGDGSYTPAIWKGGHGQVIDSPSLGLRRYIFTSPEEAMIAAYRERVQRDLHRRNRSMPPDSAKLRAPWLPIRGLLTALHPRH